MSAATRSKRTTKSRKKAKLYGIFLRKNGEVIRSESIPGVFSSVASAKAALADHLSSMYLTQDPNKRFVKAL
jgi:hypothetical protein